MKAVDILSNHGFELSLLLQLCQLVVGSIGLGVRRKQFGPIKAEKLFRLAFIERMA